MSPINSSMFGWWKRFCGLGAKAAAVTLVVVLLMLPGVSHALTLGQQPLVGLKGVYVMTTVESPKPEEIELLGLTKDQIQKDVELRLRKSGIKVLTNKEWATMPGTPSLMVSLSAFTYLALCVYSIRVELFEAVTLVRGGQTSASVWEAGLSVGMVGTKSIRTVRENIGDKIDEFINDYLAANPKK